MGLIDLVTFSDGTKIAAPKLFRESQSKLKKAQQHLSRKMQGSKRYAKQKLKVAHLHLKVANQRSWYIHNLTARVVTHFDHIFMEDLNVAAMKKILGKSISDAAFGEILWQMEYKSRWYGKSFHRICRWFPSSKTCNTCGYKIQELSLDIREWVCPSCGEIHDRDINAAKNILDQGLRELYNLTSEEISDYKRGEEIRRANSGAFLSETFIIFPNKGF